MSEVTLSDSTRTVLLSLQRTGALINRTQDRLATGLKVASPLDDAEAYFLAKGLTDRANDLLDLKEDIDLAASTLGAAVIANNIGFSCDFPEAGAPVLGTGGWLLTGAMLLLIGFFGIPTLGYYIGLAYEDLNFPAVWTYLYFLIIMVVIFDLWSGFARRRIPH